MKQPTDYGPILHIEDLAEIHGVAVRTLYDAMQNRRLWPYTELPRIGRKQQWSRDHVFAVIAGQTPRARAAGR